MTIHIFASLFALLPALLAGPAAAQTENKVLCDDLKLPFFRVTCDEDKNCSAGPGRAESLAREFPVPKTSGLTTLFIFGESAATLLGDGEVLAETAPGLKMINCGMSGYESWRISGVFREALQYKPDLAVLLSGNNEEGGYNCKGFAFKLRSRYRSTLEKLYTWKTGAETAPFRASLRLHKQRLSAMAAEAKKRKTPLILCTLPVNLAGAPPSGTPPLDNEAFAAGLAAFEQKKYEKAAGLFTESLKGDPRNPFPKFWLGRSLEALKRFEEAKGAYLQALEADPRPGRTSPARNEMIRDLAAKEGAGLCDLERAFYGVSRNGIPGAEQFSDAASWRPFYNGLVWDELLKTADGMGLAAFKDLPSYPPSQIPPEEELKKDFSNALAEIEIFASASPAAASPSAGFLCEKALAGIAFMESRWPGSLEKTALSEEAFRNMFISSAWSAGTASRLEQLRPQFLAHLAEAQRRRGNFAKALSLAERAIAADPDRLYFRPVKALALAGLGRKKEAEKELSALCAAPALKSRARALGLAYGLSLPEAGTAPAAAADSKKLADDGTEKLRAGDPAAAEKLLAGAVKLNPSNAEAFLSLCSAQFAQKKFPAALESCDSARWGAEAYYPAAKQTLVSEASYLKAQVLGKMGRTAAAGEELKKSLQDPPAGWKNLEAAKAELEKTDKK